MTDKEIIDEYNKLSTNELNQKFIEACISGELHKVKILLTSPELKYHANIHTDGDFEGIDFEDINHDKGLFFASINGNYEVVKYLLLSDELFEKADIRDIYFHCLNGSLSYEDYCKPNLELTKLLLSEEVQNLVNKKNNFNKEVKETIEEMFEYIHVEDKHYDLFLYFTNELKQKVSFDNINGELFHAASRNNYKVLEYLVAEKLINIKQDLPELINLCKLHGKSETEKTIQNLLDIAIINEVTQSKKISLK